MIQYLIVLLDDTSISFCHYTNKKSEIHLIELSYLKAAILFAMKENLMLQFVYPEYKLPQEYEFLINNTIHSRISSAGTITNTTKGDKADIVVVNDWSKATSASADKGTIYVWRTTKYSFFNHYDFALDVLEKVTRLNIILTDIEYFDEKDFEDYKRVLSILSDGLVNIYTQGREPQFNLLTDRMMLNRMNNCNAGWESITLAPNGKFYVCPAFYHENAESVGDLKLGVNIKNQQLYKLDHAPLCRNCDAYQCTRCIWLNHKTTMEVNTPSHQQCVTAHLERNASKQLLENIRQHQMFLPNQVIKAIDYLDPFDVRKEW